MTSPLDLTIPQPEGGHNLLQGRVGELALSTVGFKNKIAEMAADAGDW